MGKTDRDGSQEFDRKEPRMNARSLSRVILFLGSCCLGFSTLHAQSTASIPGSSSRAGNAAHAIPAPPPTAIHPFQQTLHGVTIEDPYHWLEDRHTPAAQAWIAAQQRYTAKLLTSRPGIAPIRRQIQQLVHIEEPRSVLYRNGNYFIERKPAGSQQAGIYFRKGTKGSERLLIGPGHSGLSAADSISLLNVSANGRILAYGVRHGGRDQLSIHFFNVDQGEDLSTDTLPEARYLYWALPITSSGSDVYYIRFTAAGPRLYRHRFGQPVTDDTLSFGKGIGPFDLLSARLSPDDQWLLVTVLHGASGSTDLYLKRLHSHSSFTPVVTRKNATFNGVLSPHNLYIETNWKAGRGQVFSASLAHPQPSHWKLLIPQLPNLTIQSLHLTRNRLVLNVIHDAHSELRTYSLTGKPSATISLPGAGSIATVNAEPSSRTMCFSYTSFRQPTGFFSWSPSGLSSIDVPSIPSALHNIVVTQVWYHSTGGVSVPMWLAYRRGLMPDGKLPVLLYGYGGFGWAQLPTFTTEEAAWIEQGGVYAIANIRGGDEFGEAWHRAGDLNNKQNGFDDFANAARWLIHHHYTNPHRLAIQGMSNGGLLVMVSITQHPGLFAAAIGRYPLIDMMSYEQFGIGRWWTSEYGSVSDPAQFKAIYAYSPYQHIVKNTPYPAALLITGNGDTRVDPANSLKMTAMLQNATSSGKPVLLLYDSTSGHSGSLPADLEINQTASELEFLDWQLQLTRKSRPAEDSKDSGTS
jgi:prolyl oligopeptidase